MLIPSYLSYVHRVRTGSNEHPLIKLQALLLDTSRAHDLLWWVVLGGQTVYNGMKVFVHSHFLLFDVYKLKLIFLLI